mmetsp:Transcript_4431/g.16224  ORF Transcript_4431/g.16224 Transcript_4431/m.16224 type:complete len:252 (+) Transcript_4431:1205-1960(+)
MVGVGRAQHQPVGLHVAKLPGLDVDHHAHARAFHLLLSLERPQPTANLSLAKLTKRNLLRPELVRFRMLPRRFDATDANVQARHVHVHRRHLWLVFLLLLFLSARRWRARLLFHGRGHLKSRYRGRSERVRVVAARAASRTHKRRPASRVYERLARRLNRRNRRAIHRRIRRGQHVSAHRRPRREVRVERRQRRRICRCERAPGGHVGGDFRRQRRRGRGERRSHGFERHVARRCVARCERERRWRMTRAR